MVKGKKALNKWDGSNCFVVEISGNPADLDHPMYLRDSLELIPPPPPKYWDYKSVQLHREPWVS